MADKELLDFDRELQSQNMPLLGIILQDNRFKDLIFKEFLKTKQKPSFILFLQTNYPKININRGFETARINLARSRETDSPSWPTEELANFNKLLQKDREFEELIEDAHIEFSKKAHIGDIDSKIFSHDITVTNIFKQLSKIQNAIKDFEILALDESLSINSYPRYVESFADQLFKSIRALDNEALRVAVYKWIIDYEENSAITIQQMFGNESLSAQKRYTTFRNLFEPYFANVCSALFSEPSINSANNKQHNEVQLKLDKDLKVLEHIFIDSTGYDRAKMHLANYFLHGIQPDINQSIEIKNRNKGKLAIVLGQTFRDLNNRPIDREYIDFVKKVFAVLETEMIGNSVNSSTIYKAMQA